MMLMFSLSVTLVSGVGIFIALTLLYSQFLRVTGYAKTAKTQVLTFPPYVLYVLPFSYKGSHVSSPGLDMVVYATTGMLHPYLLHPYLLRPFAWFDLLIQPKQRSSRNFNLFTLQPVSLLIGLLRPPV